MSPTQVNEVNMLHPDISAFLDMVDDGRQAGRPALHELSVAQARDDFDASSQALEVNAPALPVQHLHVPARDGQALPARLYGAPAQASVPRAVLLYLHGGGYTVGSLDSHDGLCRNLAQACDCAVLAVAYRLAPQAPFPTAVDDTRDAWAWLQAQAFAHGLDVGRIAVAGDSAGATLATVLAAQLAAEGGPQPRAQLLFYPAADATRRSESQELFAEGYLLETASLDWFYQQYAPQPAQRRDWRCSPLYAGQALRGSAPALVYAAQFDPLLDEGLAYAEALREQGVTVQAQLCHGMTHDFLRMGGLVPEVQGYFDQAGQFLSRHW
ncbi:alpha/beta hydrolase [Pseudomonas putida]